MTNLEILRIYFDTSHLNIGTFWICQDFSFEKQSSVSQSQSFLAGVLYCRRKWLKGSQVETSIVENGFTT